MATSGLVFMVDVLKEKYAAHINPKMQAAAAIFFALKAIILALFFC
jgi:hypothetical protein